MSESNVSSESNKSTLIKRTPPFSQSPPLRKFLARPPPLLPRPKLNH